VDGGVLFGFWESALSAARRLWGAENDWSRPGQSRVGWFRHLNVQGAASPYISALRAYILSGVAKHLVDIDEDALDDARRELGTRTIKDTINLALRRAGARRADDVKRALDVLARAELAPREQAWR
jgi:Arc/MetJ family transcription regulator